MINMKLKRMFAIIFYLLFQGKLTAEELGEQLDVSPFTIYEDAARLKSSGVPVIAEKGPGGGYSLLESFFLRGEYISLDDLIDLYFMLHPDEQDKDDCAESIKKFISSLISILPSSRGKGLLEDTEFELQPSGYRERHPQKLYNFYKAIQAKDSIEIGYKTPENKIEFFQVWPEDLIYNKKQWFLAGYSSDENNYRLYELARITEYTKNPEGSFSQCEDVKPNKNESDHPRQHESGLENSITCHLLFHEETSSFLRNFFPSGAIVKRNDLISAELKEETWLEGESILVIVRWPDNEWVRRTILSFGSRVKVLSPGWLAAEIKNEAEIIVSRHTLQEEE